MGSWSIEGLQEALGQHVTDELRTPQLGSLAMLGAYLEEEPTGSALIRMPTGSGKTGVIALAAREMVGGRSALVLTHRTALQSQLYTDIRIGFFERAGIVGMHPREVSKLDVATLLRDGVASSTVYVSTIQSLVSLRDRAPERYNDLANELGLVLFDEGQYEPSPEWSNAVRGLMVPTVLLSATPYRNDVAAFDIDLDFLYSYTFQQGVDAGYIRDVEWETGAIADTDPVGFAESLVQYVRGPYEVFAPVEQAKVMVRCATVGSVEAVAEAIRSIDPSVVAVHDRFPGGGGWKRRHSGDIREDPSTYWVHQYKLLEGVDEPRFSLVALYEPPRSARAVVQQVGRAIRATGHGERARVLAVGETKAQRQWEAYLDFERDPDGLEASIRLWRGGSDVLDDLLPLEESPLYVLGDFRHWLDPRKDDLSEEIRLRPTVEILISRPNFSFETALQQIEQATSAQRVFLRTLAPDEHSRLVLWVSYTNSPIVAESHFPDREFGYTFVRAIGTRIFYSDSQGWRPQHLDEMSDRMATEEMKRLLDQDTTDRVMAIDLLNPSVGRQHLRSQTLRAFDLTSTAVGVADAGYVPTAARARVVDHEGNESHSRRYIGLSRARVSDEGARLTVGGYLEWINSLEDVLFATHEFEPAFLLNRYAGATDPPADATAQNVLFDLSEFLEEAQIDGPEEVCVSQEEGQFRFQLDGKNVVLEVTWDAGRRRFETASVGHKKEPVPGLIQHLNRHQPLRVIPEATGYVYTRGEWYRPTLTTADQRRAWDSFLPVFETLGELSGISSEKGSVVATGGAGWEEGSLFEFVDRDDSPICPADIYDILVCDDMYREVADFIAASTTQQRVTFFHLKTSNPPRPESAAALSEVCAQAVKNLGYFNPFDAREPPNLSTVWAKPWSAPPHCVGAVKSRLRRKPVPSWSGRRIWREIRDLISAPTTQREVAVVVGGGLSKGGLENRITRNRLTAEDNQLYHQVTGAWSAATAVGATFRIYCSE